MDVAKQHILTVSRFDHIALQRLRNHVGVDIRPNLPAPGHNYKIHDTCASFASKCRSRQPALERISGTEKRVTFKEMLAEKRTRRNANTIKGQSF